eukprot:TRINITY_DN1003_c0_g2_i4.p1 TRINITY_DN1003_c0_g2~~TRINITY_DN1003_c0_g2_i4.p1  ORF type:complete len:254 (+),score=24.13 TRINITY_DN1003_c0_g2_i4:74-835(+)
MKANMNFGENLLRLDSTEFLRRPFNFSQWDIEASVWLMYNLFFSPKSVYSYQRTKHQSARDDPSFLVFLCCGLMCTSTACAIFFAPDWSHVITIIFWTILVDFVLVGVVLSTLFWFVANNYLREKSATYSVEWGYSFDIHCNSFFPVFVLLYVVQFFFFFLNSTGYVSLFLSNTLYIVALGYYHYITFLGYTSLKFLTNTHWLLTPYVFCVFLYILTVVVLPLCGIYWNATAIIFNFYFGKVGIVNAPSPSSI